MKLPPLTFREYPFLVSEAIKSPEISSFLYKAISDLYLAGDKTNVEIDADAEFDKKVEASYVLYTHDTHTIAILNKEGFYNVAVWDSSEFSTEKYDFESFLNYASMDGNKILKFSNQDITLKAAEASGSYVLNNAAEKYIRNESFLAARQKRDPVLKANTVIIKEGDCDGACETLSRLVDLYNFLESKGYTFESALDFKEGTGSTALIEQIIFSATAKARDLRGIERDAQNMYKHIEYVYEKGLTLKETFRFNDSDYSVSNASKESPLVCLHDQEILFTIRKRQNGMFHIETTCEYEKEQELISNNIDVINNDKRDYARRLADLALVISPEKIELLGSHLYSFAIDLQGAVSSMLSELDGIDPGSLDDDYLEP